MENQYTKLFEFVKANASADPSMLRLKYHGRDLPGIDVDFAIMQIECRRRFGKKLAATIAAFPEFLFPSVLAGEQATSDLFADFHASLVAGACRVGDLTAGLGIDLFHIARLAESIVAVELDFERFNMLQYNKLVLAPKLHAVNDDCRKFVAEYNGDKFDALFIDPARRAENGSRVFSLTQCQPDVVDMLPDIMKITRRLVIKMSPMLDISKVEADIRSVVGNCGLKIYSVGTPGECRELVTYIDFENNDSETLISAVTLFPDESIVSFDFTREEEARAEENFGMPEVGDVVVEPYASVMKAAPWKLFGVRYGLRSPAPNSHLFFAKHNNVDMPAQQLQIIDVIPYTSGNIKRLKKSYPKASIVCRNFDITPEVLRKKLNIAEGENVRIIATKSSIGQPFLIIAAR